MELRTQRARLRDGLALQDLGHQGGRGGRNRAAAPLEADIGDAVALDREINRDPVAAQRVVAARQMRWMFESAEIARVAPVIEDDVLVELAPIHSMKSSARPMPTAPAISGVPASKRCGGSRNSVSAYSTLAIMPPPVCQGGIESSAS